MAVKRDMVDELITQWKRERPDLDLAAMGTIGRLGRLNAHLHKAVTSVFTEHGLQVGEFDVLATLRRAGKPFAMTPTALARMMMLSPAGMTSRIDRLEALDLVERRPDPDDRRSSLVALTAKGRTVVDAAVTDHVDNENRLVSPLTVTERRTLDDLLRKLLAQFDLSS